MELFELVIALLLGGAVLTAWAERRGVPFPPLLALAGAIAAVVPGTPEIALEPGLALALFVAPVLLDAAFDTNLRDLRVNWLPVSLLVFGAVGATVAAVAVVARWAAGWMLDGGMGWAPAVVLGAIVAPPDASAATSVLRRVRPPHRMMVVLEGESLLNDASALLIYRVAVGAAAAGSVHWAALPVLLLLTAAGGVALGMAAALLMLRLSPLLRDHLPVWVMVQFLACFAVWLVADALTLSPIITMVAFAIFLARRSPANMDGRSRIASYAVWDVAVFVLNILAFVLVGLQLKSILGRLDGALGTYLLFAGIVLGVVILARFAVLTVGNPLLVLLEPHARDRQPTVRGSVAVGWCGMRGIVTLAASLALPAGFPHRDLLVFTAFAVTLGTLVLQGFTLGPLLRLLRLEDDGSVEREVLVGRRGALEAVHRHLQQAGTQAAMALAQKYAGRLDNSDAAGDHGADEAIALRRAAIAVGRAELAALRSRGLIGDDAFHLVEEEFDLDEISADPRLRWGAPAGRTS